MAVADTEDHIDTGHWLERGEPIVTPERAAKGDLHVENGDGDQIRFAQLAANSVMNHLHRKGVLDDQHAHEGGIYEIWQVCFSAELGYRTSSIYASDLQGMRRVIADEHLEVADFERLIRALTAAQKRIVEFCLYTTATEHARWMADRNVGAIRGTFDRMSEVMKRLKEEADASHI